MPPVKKTTQKQLRAARALEVVPHPGFSFTHKHYVFIAKAKAGELWALNHLSVKARAAITPLFEMWPPKKPDKKKDSDAPPKAPKALSVHASDILTLIRDEWGALPFFLDTRYIPAGGIPSASSATEIFNICRALNLKAIPVTSLTAEPAYQHAIRAKREQLFSVFRVSVLLAIAVGLLTEGLVRLL